MLLLAAIAVSYIICVNIVARLYGIQEYSELFRTSRIGITTLAITLAVIAFSHLADLIFAKKVDRPIFQLWQDIKTHVLAKEMLITRTVPIITLICFLASFVYMKSLIKVFHPFSFDATFYELDRLLTFGTDPWRITHALFGSVTATFLIDWAYNAWFAIKWFVFIFFVIKVDKPGIRAQYFIASLLCWIILGSLFAIGLSSAGPVYYEHIVGSSLEYGPLMEHLGEINAQLVNQGLPGIKALELQEILWYNNSLGTQNLVSGISAMPSMHVSVATLMALGGWKLNRTLGILLTSYAAIIMIGSVHLGWHYAVDGYFSIIGTFSIWYGTGYVMKRMQLHDEAQDQLR
jgi:hypothetical protein